MMTFEIESSLGTYVDITEYIAFGGLEYQLSDVDSPNSGRNLAGTMIRGKVTDKDKFMFKFRALTTEELHMILQLVTKEYVSCRYLSPRYGTIVIKTMYVGDRRASHLIDRPNQGTMLWHDLAFSLIER